MSATDRVSRVAPLAPPWSAEDAEGISSWGHPDRTYEPLLLVRCLQRHPKLAARLRKMGESLYVDARLPARIRTIAILRICGLLHCEYEWGGQAAFWGPIAGGLDDEQRMELLAAVGWYRTICTLCNSLALPVEGWMRPWPSA